MKAAVVEHVTLGVKAVGGAEDVGVGKVFVPAQSAAHEARRVVQPHHVHVRDEHWPARDVQQRENGFDLARAERDEEGGVAADVDRRRVAVAVPQRLATHRLLCLLV
jgi:hypothetical protein